MARLDPNPYPDMPEFDSTNWKKSLAEQDEALAKIPSSKLVQFGVADGYAYYYIKSEKPFVLQHIRFGDNYQIAPAYIRGLKLSDVR